MEQSSFHIRIFINNYLWMVSYKYLKEYLSCLKENLMVLHEEGEHCILVPVLVQDGYLLNIILFIIYYPIFNKLSYICNIYYPEYIFIFTTCKYPVQHADICNRHFIFNPFKAGDRGLTPPPPITVFSPIDSLNFVTFPK